MFTPAYRWASTPVRATLDWTLRLKQQSPVMILFYHRVADFDPNPWTIGNDEFERQLNWMESRFDFVSMEECQRRLRHGSSKPSVHITFDDGYGDNCHKALPLLIKREIPFTYFVTLNNILKNQPFPHDVALGKPLRPNAVNEIHALAHAGVEIGNHTRSHANVGRLRPEEVEREVVDAGKELEDIIGKRVRYFAFPFGQVNDLNLQAAERLKEEGYEGVCSAYGGYNLPSKQLREIEAFHMQRFHGDPQFSRIENWLTLDPRWYLRSRPWDPPVEWFGETPISTQVGTQSTEEQAASTTVTDDPLIEEARP